MELNAREAIAEIEKRETPEAANISRSIDELARRMGGMTVDEVEVEIAASRGKAVKLARDNIRSALHVKLKQQGVPSRNRKIYVRECEPQILAQATSIVEDCAQAYRDRAAGFRLDAELDQIERDADAV